MIRSLGIFMSSSAFVTVVTGVSVYVLGQIILKGGIEPYNSFREELGKISNVLLINQAKIINPNSEIKPDLILDLKAASANLMAKYSALPFYIKKNYFGLHLVPSRSEILRSSQNLNFLASIHEGRSKESTWEHIVEIGHMLKIPTTYSR